LRGLGFVGRVSNLEREDRELRICYPKTVEIRLKLTSLHNFNNFRGCRASSAVSGYFLLLIARLKATFYRVIHFN
jgi:hypothetical protein